MATAANLSKRKALALEKLVEGKDLDIKPRARDKEHEMVLILEALAEVECCQASDEPCRLKADEVVEALAAVDGFGDAMTGKVLEALASGGLLVG